MDGSEPDASVDDWHQVTYFSADVGYWFAKLYVASGVVTVMFTNLRALWSESEPLETFYLRLKQSNANLEGDTQPLMQLCRRMLQQKVDCKVNVETLEDSSLVVRFHGKFAGIPFRWSTHVVVTSSDLFYAEIVEPLLLTVLQYERREKKLLEIVEQKDAMLQDALRICSPDKKSSTFSSEEWSKQDFESVNFKKLQKEFLGGKIHPFASPLLKFVISQTNLLSDTSSLSEAVKAGPVSSNECDATSRRKPPVGEKLQNLNIYVPGSDYETPDRSDKVKPGSEDAEPSTSSTSSSKKSAKKRLRL